VLPTLLTLGNGLCGLGAATYAMQATTHGDRGLLLAGLCIFAAMIFDTLDGGAARWMRQTSRFGSELDSLCDAVSFGVAPALIVIQITDDYHSRILWAIAALFMCCAILRLARYNVESSPDSQEWFSGLPSPAAAATVASFAMIAANDPVLALPDAARQLLPNEAGVLRAMHNIVPLVAIALAVLMVSRVRYPHLIRQMLRSRRNFRYVPEIVFTLTAIVLLGAWAAPVVLCAFVAVSPIRSAWQTCHRAARHATRLRQSAADDGDSAADRRDKPPRHSAQRLRLWWPVKGNNDKRRRA
jgi:CDP-diacylglycerol--serine O-phosphatidyltransferase